MPTARILEFRHVASGSAHVALPCDRPASVEALVPRAQRPARGNVAPLVTCSAKSA